MDASTAIECVVRLSRSREAVRLWRRRSARVHDRQGANLCRYHHVHVGMYRASAHTRPLEKSVSQSGIDCLWLMVRQPERITGNSHTITSDIWSFGMTLLECACGRYPFTREGGGSLTFFELLEWIQNCEPPKLPPSYSAEFQSLIDLWYAAGREGAREREACSLECGSYGSEC